MIIYTDGACSQGSTQNGGWGVVVIDNNDEIIKVLSGNKKETTNNEMELTAFLNALKYALDSKEKEISIATDSAYIYNSVTQGWLEAWKSKGWKRPKNKELAHKEIWIKVDYLISMIQDAAKLTFIKVQGHSTNKGNNLADQLAVNEREKLNKGEI